MQNYVMIQCNICALSIGISDLLQMLPECASSLLHLLGSEELYLKSSPTHRPLHPLQGVESIIPLAKCPQVGEGVA